VLVCGYLSDRLGRKAVLTAAVALFALGLTLTAAAHVFALALLAAAFVGAGSGATEVVASALAADLYPHRRALLLNSVQIAFGGGAAIGPYVAHQMLAHGSDWRVIYLGLAAGQAALLIFIGLQRVPDLGDASEVVRLGALLRILAHPVFVALCLAQALYVGAEVAFASWMPTYFRDSLPGGVIWEGLVVTVFWVAMTVGRIAVGPLIGRLPLLRMAALLAAGGAVGGLLTTLAAGPTAAMLCVAWTGLCLSGVFGLILAECGSRFPSASGTAFGGLTASGGIGGALLPWLAALLAATSLHWRGALLLVPAAMCGVSAILYFVERVHPAPR
jgi:MFS transporter, FHS family, glucose/mannose:H+ symporter